MDDPTIFGLNGNRLMAGGESGPEAIAPIDTLQGYVASAVASQNAMLVEALDRIHSAILSMDENMGGHMKEALDDTAFKINNREFGRLVRGVT
jgi:phage-related minor tail protein